MKIVIGYPPLETGKGYACLGQNRQFQWVKTPWTAYPIVPAYAASLLKDAGYEVYWLDGIWGGQSYQQWLDELKKIKPDLIFLETKTPVVKLHWKIISNIKAQISNIKIVLAGDHVTAMPAESFENSKVDYILTGGNYDFLLLSLVEHLTKGKKLGPGIWYRQKSKIKSQKSKRQIKNEKILNTGRFELNNNLDKLPFIDRNLTKWRLYAYKNANYLRLPGSYTMFGRDCWWGRCTFCLTGETEVITKQGTMPIREIVENKKGCSVLTHKARYKKINNYFKRRIKENIIKIKSLYLPFDLELTKNHNVYAIPREDLRRCSKRNAWSYFCKPNRISKFLDCKTCQKKYFLNYKPKLLEAKLIKKGDFLAIPIERKIKDIKTLKVKKILSLEPTTFVTKKKISNKKINKILLLSEQGGSERFISKKLLLDRETVHRYICLKKDNLLEKGQDLLSQNTCGISFKGGKKKIPSEIKIDKDFAYLAGLYLAEGCVSYSKYRPNSAYVSWTFSKNEEKLINSTINIFKNKFKNNLIKTLNKRNNTYQLCFGSTITARFFRNLFGKNCYQKSLPISFMTLGLDKQRALLQGLFHGDAHLRTRGGDKGKGGAEYILSTTSKKMAEQVFLTLLRFDAIPSFRFVKKNKKNEADSYVITLSREDILRVFPDIKLNQKKVSYKKGFVLDNFAMIPVISVKERQFKGDVYNLSVEQDHSYVANGITVKNCSWTTLYPGKNFKSTSPKRALDEIGHLIENYGTREIMDDSGTFPVGDWLKKFCRGMIKRGYHRKVRISCNMRFNAGLTRKDYLLMGKAGFRFLLYGLESVNQKTLDKINKNLKVKQIEPVLVWAKEAGLNPHLTAMIGYPWETKKEAQKTLNFAKRLFEKGLADTLQATIVIPYPGTPLFDQAKKNDWLKTKDWDKYDMRQPILKTEMTDEEIKEMVQGLYKSIFSPQFVFRKTKEAFSDWDTFKYYLRLAAKFPSKLMDFTKKSG